MAHPPAQIWERRRRIPSTTYNDPLDHIFAEFDEDGDGHLTAEEVAKALQSRGVQADAATVQHFIDGELERGMVGVRVRCTCCDPSVKQHTGGVCLAPDSPQPTCLMPCVNSGTGCGMALLPELAAPLQERCTWFTVLPCDDG